jgi:hypothetical protein
MKVVFLDIDGVLNQCMSPGVFDKSSTDPFCIAILNEALRRTGAKVVIISTWKDSFDINVVVNLLYSREFLANSILGGTEKDIPKELGIKNFLENHSEVEKFVIIDDSLELQDDALKNFCVRTDSNEGISVDDMKKIVDLLNKN